MTVRAAASLQGRSVLVTRPRGRARALVRSLRRKGARIVELPLIAIAYPSRTPALDAAIGRLAAFDWIVFTSAHGVTGFWRRLRALGEGVRPLRDLRIAAVGTATARALRRRGVRVDLVPKVQTGRGLLAALREKAPLPARILVPRSDLAPRSLPDALHRAGHLVESVVAYRTVTAPRPGAVARRAARAADAALFFSPSAVRQFGRMGLRSPHALIACIGPTTVASARKAGLRADVVPSEPTPRALVAALGQAFVRADRP